MALTIGGRVQKILIMVATLDSTKFTKGLTRSNKHIVKLSWVQMDCGTVSIFCGLSAQ